MRGLLKRWLAKIKSEFLNILLARWDSSRSMPLLHVHATCYYCMSLLHDHAAYIGSELKQKEAKISSFISLRSEKQIEAKLAFSKTCAVYSSFCWFIFSER